MACDDGVYSVKRAYIDFDDLLSRGFMREGIIHFCTIAVRFVQDELRICLTRGEDVTELHNRICMVDTIYSECEIAIEHLGHHKIDVRVCLNVPASDAGYIKLVPRMPLLEKQAQEPNVFMIPNGLFAPRKMYLFTEPILRTYPKVLFAGTFDHLHAGHKSVLTQAMFHATETLYVGIASEALLARKKCAAALQPFTIRSRLVHDFLTSIKPTAMSNISVELLETPDAIGPAATLDFDAIVVTPETLAGSQLVNEARANLGHKPVEIVTLSILGNRGLEDKLSSTGIRTHLCSQLSGGEDDLNWLQIRWKSLCATLGVSESSSAVWWSNLRDSYGLDPWRKYHNLRHIFELLQSVGEEEVSSALLLAIWFHDCVYQPRSGTNEEDSTNVFQNFVREVTVIEEATAREVEHAIRLTKQHIVGLSSDLSNLATWIPKFLELDLAILGSSHERYREYSQQIRTEYAHVPDETFKEKRSQLLESWSGFRFRYLDSLNERLTQNIAWELASYQ